MTRLVGEEVELRLALADDLALVRADPGQIEQVLINLVVNARDAMPRGGMVTISTRNEWASPTANGAPTEHVLIRVSDMGLGIAPEMLDRIFEPFFTTKEPGKGTGLGLATVHGIVEQSGGFVRVTSEVGRGTTFSVYLPKYEPTESGAKWQSTLSGDVTR
jgi:two-component system cell cycle sensor histidine kinase/response regulator CckA